MEFPGPGTAMAFASAVAMGASAIYSSQNEKIAIGLMIAGLVLALVTVWIEKMHTRKEVIKCLIVELKNEDKIEKALEKIRGTGVFFTKLY
jgi:hypothetical protein